MDVCEIQDIVRAVFPANWKGRYLAMFSAYFDESGTHDGSPLLSIAGYASPESEWRAFQKEWKHLLGQYGIEFFHMTDFENRQAQFKGWKQDKRLNFIRRAIKIIKSRAKVGVGIAVVKSDFKRTILRKFSKGTASPYVLGAQCCMLELSKWLNEWLYKDSAAYVFESGAADCGRLTEQFKRIMSNDSSRVEFKIHSLVFADKKEIVPLQAADILAYESWKHHSRKFIGEKYRARRSFEALLEPPGPAYVGYILDKRGLGLLARHGNGSGFTES